MDERQTTADASRLNAISRYITERSGIGFDDRKKEQLAQIVKTRCKALGLDRMGAYDALLRASGPRGGEFNTLMDMLTIQESCFFRHRAQFDALRRFCLPAMMQQKGYNHRINIWSAGCANGEEAYSIAMLVRDLIPDKPETRVFIKGTDISERALESAREGIYSRRAVRALSPGVLVRYFKREGERFLLVPEIRDMVAFEWLNLSEGPFSHESMPVWDIIFCRNVVIYFTKEHSRQLMKHFFAGMAEGGFLFAGSSETIRYLNEDFVPIQVEDAFIYQKPLWGEKPARRRAMRPQKDAPARPPVLPLKKETPSRVGPKSKRPGMPLPVPSRQDQKFSGDEAQRPARDPLDARLSLAGQLADKGETLEAVALIDEVIRQDPLRVKAYFMLALICRNAGDTDQAAQYLKKVIYLEPENPLAHLHLGDVFKASYRKAHAVREYTNVISLLQNRDDLEGEVYGDGFTGEAILTAARAHLKSLDAIDPTA
jgi:chemotaxis protein methyltransferase CheR